MMAGGSEDTTGAVPQSISPDEIEKLTAKRREMFRRKEAERIGKWERMLVVAERDAGGNAVRWKWEEAGKGRKVSILVDSVGHTGLRSDPAFWATDYGTRI
jgi:hypothetical protein